MDMWNSTNQLSNGVESLDISELKQTITLSALAEAELKKGELMASENVIDEMNQAMKDAFALLDETEKQLCSPV